MRKKVIVEDVHGNRFEAEREEPRIISENEMHKYYSTISEEEWQNSRDINEYIADVKNGKIIKPS